MNSYFTFISRSLAAKLIVAIVLLILVGGGISWYTLIRAGRKNLVNEAVRDTASYSEIIHKSIRYSMLTNNRDAIQGTIEELASVKDLKGIRLFDGKGRIYYSSKQEEIGKQIDRSAPACVGCHRDPANPSGTLAKEIQWTTAVGSEGHTTLFFVEPIYNEPSCSRAACHVHSPSQRVLGILESDFSLVAVDRKIREQMVHTTVYAMAFMCVVSVILTVILRKFVLKPLTSLSDAMGAVAQGDLGRTAVASSDDELGRLVHTFNAMTVELRGTREKMEAWTETLEREVANKTKELKSSRDNLIQAEKLAALGRLTADVAHEIRNPLTAIGGFARRLQKSLSAEKERARAEIIVTEVDRLEKILRDVLTFSRDAQLHLEKHLVAEFLHDVVSAHEPVCAEQSIAVEVRMEQDLPPVLIDRYQVEQALTNLITYAIDAMPRGGTLKIIAGTEELHDVHYVILQVSDTGQGMSQDVLPLIFEPFYSIKTTSHGTSLGLAITRKIIEEHGGFVKAESEQGKGSRFSLYFPLQSDDVSGALSCWEYKKCGRDKDATAKCPAYPNFGRSCWVVAGTFCQGKVQGTFAQKYEDCRKCDFFQMARKLKERTA
jgi:two-component system NtrC family sensor kinase